jgi:hypothetical protein
MKMRQKRLPTAVMIGIVVAVVVVVGIAVVVLKGGPGPSTTTTTSPTTTTTSTVTTTTSPWTPPQGERIGFFEVVLDLEVLENGWDRAGTVYCTSSSTDLINEFFGSSQYDCLYLENFVQENGKKKYLFRADSNVDSYLIEHGIPPIHQDDIGRKFCFYMEWRVFYISEPVIFSMTVILPPGYEVDNVQCANPNGPIPYVITSQDNRAKVVVENARIEESFDTFRLRIDYENTLL